MELQPGVHPVRPVDLPRTAEVWEASVRATHDFVSDEDVRGFRPLVEAELPNVMQLVCVRDIEDQVAGFVGVEDGKVEMLFLHPDCIGQGAGRRLLDYAISEFGATTLDVNEQNEHAVAFYLHMGFVVEGRSADDGQGKPYPLLHLRLAGS